MTYLQFHLLFTIPPIILLAGWLAFRHRTALRVMTPGIGLIALVAVVYTTPWDNYLVFKEVWNYGPDRVLGTIGYVPVEEYAFFILQTILTGLALTWRMAVLDEDLHGSAGPGPKWGVGLVLLAVSGAGFLALTTDQTLYFGLIAAWAFPILALQWFVGAGTLWTAGKTWIPVVVGATLYLASADAFAIASGTWSISTTYTTGIMIGSLPFEEGLFFLVTNLLVVWGLMLVRAFSTRPGRPRP